MSRGFSTPSGDLEECLLSAMNLSTSTVVTGIENLGRLEQAIVSAQTFDPKDQGQVAVLLEWTREAALKGQYERYTNFLEWIDSSHRIPKTEHNDVIATSPAL